MINISPSEQIWLANFISRNRLNVDISNHCLMLENLATVKSDLYNYCYEDEKGITLGSRLRIHIITFANMLHLSTKEFRTLLKVEVYSTNKKSTILNKVDKMKIDTEKDTEQKEIVSKSPLYDIISKSIKSIKENNSNIDFYTNTDNIFSSIFNNDNGTNSSIIFQKLFILGLLNNQLIVPIEIIEPSEECFKYSGFVSGKYSCETTLYNNNAYPVNDTDIAYTTIKLLSEKAIILSRRKYESDALNFKDKLKNLDYTSIIKDLEIFEFSDLIKSNKSNTFNVYTYLNNYSYFFKHSVLVINLLSKSLMSNSILPNFSDIVQLGIDNINKVEKKLKKIQVDLCDLPEYCTNYERRNQILKNIDKLLLELESNTYKALDLHASTSNRVISNISNDISENFTMLSRIFSFEKSTNKDDNSWTLSTGYTQKVNLTGKSMVDAVDEADSSGFDTDMIQEAIKKMSSMPNSRRTYMQEKYVIADTQMLSDINKYYIKSPDPEEGQDTPIDDNKANTENTKPF